MIQVPLFIKEGELIKIDTRTGAYMGDRTTYLGESPRNYSGDAVVKLAIVNRIGQQP